MIKTYRDWIIEAIAAKGPYALTDDVIKYYDEQCENKSRNWRHTITRKLTGYPCFVGIKAPGTNNKFWKFEPTRRHSLRMGAKEWMRGLFENQSCMISTEYVIDYYLANRKDCNNISRARIIKELKENYEEFRLSGVQSYWTIKN